MAKRDTTMQKAVEAQVKMYVRTLNRELKHVGKQMERASRYAPPIGEGLRHYNKLEREYNAIATQMERLEKIVGRLVDTDDFSYCP